MGRENKRLSAPQSTRDDLRRTSSKRGPAFRRPSTKNKLKPVKGATTQKSQNWKGAKPHFKARPTTMQECARGASREPPRNKRPPTTETTKIRTKEEAGREGRRKLTEQRVLRTKKDQIINEEVQLSIPSNEIIKPKTTSYKRLRPPSPSHQTCIQIKDLKGQQE